MPLVPDLSGNTPNGVPYSENHIVQNENILAPAQTSVVTIAAGGAAVTTRTMRDIFGNGYSGQVEIMANVATFLAIGLPGTVATSSNKPLPSSVIQIISIPADYVLSIIENGVAGGTCYVTMLNKVRV